MFGMSKRLVDIAAFRTVVCAIAAAIALTGCWIDGLLAWSPDGKYLAIAAADGLRIRNEKGELSNPQYLNAQRIAWYPDSKQLRVVSISQAKSWRDLNNLLNDTDKKHIIDSAKTLKVELSKHKSDFAACSKAINGDNFSSDYLSAALLYLKETSDSELEQLLGPQWQEQGRGADVNVATIRLFKVTSSGLIEDKVLLRTADEIKSVRISPDGEFVAVVDETVNRRLLVVKTSGGEPVVVCRRLSDRPDWTTDGRSIVVMQENKDSKLPGIIRRIEVLSANKKFLSSFDSASTLCNAAYDPEAQIKCLRDSSTIFSDSGELNNQPKTTKGLFILRRGQKVPSLLYRCRDVAGETDLKYFEVSPDEEKLTLPGEKGALEVLVLSNQKLITVSHPQSDDLGAFAPVWRTSDELCLSVPSRKANAAKNDRQVGLWFLHNGTFKAISSNWPHSALVGRLEELQPGEMSFSNLLDDLKVKPRIPSSEKSLH
jgi:hypothetical protein